MLPDTRDGDGDGDSLGQGQVVGPAVHPKAPSQPAVLASPSRDPCGTQGMLHGGGCKEHRGQITQWRQSPSSELCCAMSQAGEDPAAHATRAQRGSVARHQLWKSLLVTISSCLTMR